MDSGCSPDSQICCHPTVLPSTDLAPCRRCLKVAWDRNSIVRTAVIVRSGMTLLAETAVDELVEVEQDCWKDCLSVEEGLRVFVPLADSEVAPVPHFAVRVGPTDHLSCFVGCQPGSVLVHTGSSHPCC